jgi:hypothetical protein
MPEPTTAELRGRLAAREILTRRLVERHGLTRFTAHRAVLAVAQGRETQHADLVRAEAAEVMRPVVEAMQQFREQVRPIAEAMAKTLRAAADAIRAAQTHAQQHTTPRGRPAWQSPYGPPRKRH